MSIYIGDDGHLHQKCSVQLPFILDPSIGPVSGICEGELVSRGLNKVSTMYDHRCTVCGREEVFFSEYPRDKL